MSSLGLQCPGETDASAPSASEQRIRAWGMSPRPGATGVRQQPGSQSQYQQPTGVAGFFSAGLSDSKRHHPSPAAQVSTTRMRGMGFGLGGLDILTLEKKGVNAEGCATASTPRSLPATVPREHYTSGLAHLLSSMETGVFRTTEGKLRRDIVIWWRG